MKHGSHLMTITNNPSPACSSILMFSIIQCRQGPFFRDRHHEHKQTVRGEAKKKPDIWWPTDAFFHNELLRCFQNWGSATLNMQRHLPSDCNAKRWVWVCTSAGTKCHAFKTCSSTSPCSAPRLSVQTDAKQLLVPRKGKASAMQKALKY